MNRAAALWIELLTGPTMWMLSLLLNFTIAPWICQLHWTAAPYLVISAAIIATAIAGWLSSREWKRIREDSTEKTALHALAAAATVLSGSFIVVLLAQAIPNTALLGCS
ncbi:MAG TPA: hypothetical protein VH351_07885 [Bryobacteraceae bacterium]|jgi:hypothetical protein|nr:hypothetical protein [Bryobacteraceae bacterium]